MWKLESIYRHASDQDFAALAVGFEYTFSNVASSGFDMGILSEYLYDSRGQAAISSLENDLFMEARLALNDVRGTEILGGAILDLSGNGVFYSVEASRRLSSNLKIALEGRYFINVDPGRLVYYFREDSFSHVKISRFF